MLLFRTWLPLASDRTKLPFVLLKTALPFTLLLKILLVPELATKLVLVFVQTETLRLGAPLRHGPTSVADVETALPFLALRSCLILKKPSVRLFTRIALPLAALNWTPVLIAFERQSWLLLGPLAPQGPGLQDLPRLLVHSAVSLLCLF